MRILIVHTLYKVKGGEDSVVYNEAELLRSAGHVVDLLIFSNSKNTLLKVLQMPFNLSSYRRALQRIHEFKPEIIHVHNLHFAGSPAVLYAAKKVRVPVVMTLHNYRLLCPSGTLFFRERLFARSVNQLFPVEAVKKGVYQNSKLITFWLAFSGMLHQLAGTWEIPGKYVILGDNTRSLFADSKLKRITDRMMVKPNFCFGDTINQHTKDGYYVYVGRLSAEKGINVLLGAFGNSGKRLKIAGSGPMEAQVNQAAAKCPEIEFCGPQSPDEVRKLIAGAKALIFPSIWFETFGMVIIEAFSCGVPVIASAIGEAKHLVADNVNGLLFAPGDENDLLAKLEYFEALDDNALAKFSQQALKAYQENYTPELNLKKLHYVYNAALSSA
ncbi:MAG: glycosyltransferase family 4 protein [Mucilaginibacter sp.]